MFETLCALLLRLYPAEFRRAYGRDAVQLVRDRARDERGVLLRARLLIDLTRDLLMTSVHGWQPDEPTLARVDGAPRFDIIDVHGPRPTSLAAGLVTSILVWASFVLLSATLLTGVLFVQNLLAQHLWHKTVLSVLSWLVLGVLLFGRWRYGWRGARALKLVLTSMALLGLAFFGSKFVLELLLHKS